MTMIKSYNNYINESSENKEYNNTLEIITKLVNDGNITLKDITPEQITDLIIGKNKKYPQFGFESFMLSAAEGKMFISEGDKERMGDYIQKIKDLGIECSSLEQLYIFYKEYCDNTNELDKLESELYHTHDEDKKEINDKIPELINRIDDLQPYIGKFKNELQSISKKVVEKL